VNDETVQLTDCVSAGVFDVFWLTGLHWDSAWWMVNSLLVLRWRRCSPS